MSSAVLHFFGIDADTNGTKTREVSNPMNDSSTTNRLSGERSPYLLQHAGNPVDWWPWCDEAFEAARALDKPVFLSSGYATCHWCHVMARESFEDAEVAAVLNRDFVCIKLDREERPDVDTLYMDACVSLTGSGGWPLTVFLTHDRAPFFCGTYYPKAQFLLLLARIATLWQSSRDTALVAGQALLKRTQPDAVSRADGIGEPTLHAAYKELAAAFDEKYGGFGQAPKFPSPHHLMFLRRYALAFDCDHARQMADHTLTCMARGGLFDHLGGGFSRYSTDRRWLVPHFEKMLYDNALLAQCYAEAGRHDVARATLDYCLRELKLDNGGFATAQDADSQGVEGQYYVWTPEQVIEVLGHKEGLLFGVLHDVTSQGHLEGKSVLTLLHGDVPPQHAAFVHAAREQLLQARAQRTPPLLDHKQLTGHNGLMLAALATAARLLHDGRYLQAALDCAAFLNTCLRVDGGISMGLVDGAPMAMTATSDDVAYLAWGYYRLHQTTLDARWLDACRQAADLLLDGYMADNGLLDLSHRDVNDLPQRTQSIYDNALPCGNAIAAGVFLRLTQLTPDDRYRAAYESITAALSGSAAKHPTAHTALLSAVLLDAAGPVHVTLSGGLETQLAQACQDFHPFAVLDGTDDTKTQAVVCQDNQCGQPVTDATQLKRELQGK